MANTVLCGHVSYETKIQKKDDDSQLDLNLQMNFDNNGSENIPNSFPTKDAVLNGIELILDDSFQRTLPKIIKLSVIIKLGVKIHQTGC